MKVKCRFVHSVSYVFGVSENKCCPIQVRIYIIGAFYWQVSHMFIQHMVRIPEDEWTFVFMKFMCYIFEAFPWKFAFS